MKVRIYYKGYDNKYVCQYRNWGIWWTFEEWNNKGYNVASSFVTLDAAKEWLETARATYIHDNKMRNAAKERDKKSGIAYTEIW